jgi:hypothetical protein
VWSFRTVPTLLAVLDSVQQFQLRATSFSYEAYGAGPWSHVDPAPSINVGLSYLVCPNVKYLAASTAMYHSIVSQFPSHTSRNSNSATTLVIRVH